MIDVQIPDFVAAYREERTGVGGAKPDTYQPLLKWLVDSLGKLEELAQDIQMQREKLRNLAQGLRYEAMTLYSDDLSQADLPSVPMPDTKTPDEDQARNEVLRIAARFEVTTLEEIKAEYEKFHGRLPWKNPNAVIATILNRSSRWTRKEDGSWAQRPTPQLNI